MTATDNAREQIKKIVKETGDYPLLIDGDRDTYEAVTIPAELDITVRKHRFFRKEDLQEIPWKSFYEISITKRNSKHAAKLQTIEEAEEFIEMVMKIWRR